MAAMASQPFEIQGRRIYSAVYPRGFPPADEPGMEPGQHNHVLVVELEGSVLSTILLFGPPAPSVESVRARLMDEGDLTELNALEVTERFDMPDSGPVENKLYQPKD
jgi:hypothetical protein